MIMSLRAPKGAKQSPVVMGLLAKGTLRGRRVSTPALQVQV
jgi:hypothetical protein